MKNTLQKTREIMNKYGIKANKRYGQNFLIDDNVLAKIIEVANISQNELIIEIGPGLGNLTEYLLEKSTYCLLIEIDPNMINIINERFKNSDNFTILNEDIMKVDLDSVISKIEIEKNMNFKKVKVVANLPYYITTPIIFKLLQDENRIDQMVVMVQKEVAERMVANINSKEYGILSLMVKYLSEANIEIIVPNTSFVPSPEVTSAVIKLNKCKRFFCNDEETLFKMVHLAFAQRRKKMINSLESNHFMNMSKAQLESLFDNMGLNKNLRAEQLELDEYIKIVENLKS